ncbi:hypothetical protein TMatcc_006648 [Talaromyces marneffei ATCC 18224]|uniref:uncharacterized protein n=1 Tax=Talaromyces marneffei TaxID=37727 RepID=UPI0012A8DC6A|nr:uncharacterized protein EYB26_002420 [Talaromyces marneffei]KAE8553867.1 hypothetical protein EYB25_002405 [Talaromyces marneffei]QGA14764.1 hypothetical protein EYB26_002420 [Talaromyces marneffei]
MLGFRWPSSPSSWRRTISNKYKHNNCHSTYYGDNGDDGDGQAQRLLVAKPAVEQVRYVGFGIGGAGNIRRVSIYNGQVVL